MAINHGQNVQQATVVEGTKVRPGQVPVQLELFDTNGQPWNPESGDPIELPDNLATTDDVQSAVSGLASTQYVDDAASALESRIEALENPEG